MLTDEEKRTFNVAWNKPGHLKYTIQILKKRLNELGGYEKIPQSLHVNPKKSKEEKYI